MAEKYAEPNMRYGNPAMGKVMGHDKKPMKCNPFAAQKADMGKLRKEPQTNRGYPKQAWEYKY